MELTVKIAKRMAERIGELKKRKAEGEKIVGYFPGGFMPEEMVYACGAIPVALNRGGDHEAVEVAGSYLSRWIYTFGRAHIGYKILGTEPLYEMIDIFVVPITDNHVRLLADAWDVFTDVEVFRFGVPHVKHEDARGYFLEGLHLLKERLEKLTGSEIVEEKLAEAITLCNRERELLKKISLLRKRKNPPISSLDFMKLNHASFVLDKKDMAMLLEAVLEEIEEGEGPARDGPRILVTGSTLAHGDYTILEIIEECGGLVVIEEFGEGIRHYWETVEINHHCMDALADRYFFKRVPPAWFRPGTERLTFILNLVREFRVDGVIYYQMANRESDEFESYWYPEILKKQTGASMLKLVSDYDPGERGKFRTQIETFLQTIRR